MTGLDGDTWASQLLTLPVTSLFPIIEMTFDFSNTPQPGLYSGVQRVEVVMFNCPEWGIGTVVIQAWEDEELIAVRPVNDITSCDSLVRVCLGYTTLQSLIKFQFDGVYKWLHLAEVTFLIHNPCTPDLVIRAPPEPTTPQVTTAAAVTSEATTCKIMLHACC